VSRKIPNLPTRDIVALNCRKKIKCFADFRLGQVGERIKKILKVYDKKGQDKAIILNIALDGASKGRVLREIQVLLTEFDRSSGKLRPFLVVTPNPEIILRALTDPKLAAILNKADFSLPDGVGLSFGFLL